MSGQYSISDIDLTATTSYTGTFVTNFGGGTLAGAEAALLGRPKWRNGLFQHSQHGVS